MLKEFREFALRGNVMDMAVGIIIGAAFGKVVSSLVNDLLMPPLGVLMKGVDFSSLFVALSEHDFATLAEAEAAGVATIKYGAFITQVIDFTIVAFAIFLAIRWIAALRRRIDEPAKAAQVPELRECPFCISTIAIRATRCPHCTSELPEAAQS